MICEKKRFTKNIVNDISFEIFKYIFSISFDFIRYLSREQSFQKTENILIFISIFNFLLLFSLVNLGLFLRGFIKWRNERQWGILPTNTRDDILVP